MGNALRDLQLEFERKQAEAPEKQRETREMISACFREAIRQVGETEARRYWHDVAKRRGGKPKGTTDRERDEQLLSLFDGWVRRYPNRKSWGVRFVADHLAGKFRGTFGSSASAIAVQLRRLLLKRERERPRARNALGEMAQTGKVPIGAVPWIINK